MAASKGFFPERIM